MQLGRLSVDDIFLSNLRELQDVLDDVIDDRRPAHVMFDYIQDTYISDPKHFDTSFYVVLCAAASLIHPKEMRNLMIMCGTDAESEYEDALFMEMFLKLQFRDDPVVIPMLLPRMIHRDFSYFFRFLHAATENPFPSTKKYVDELYWDNVHALFEYHHSDDNVLYEDIKRVAESGDLELATKMHQDFLKY